MAICPGRNILNLDVNICYCVRTLPGRTPQTQNKWAAHLRHLTKPLLTCLWKNANCPSTAIFWIQWNQTILIITDLWPGLFSSGDGKDVKSHSQGWWHHPPKMQKKCSAPSCPDRARITRLWGERPRAACGTFALLHKQI